MSDKTAKILHLFIAGRKSKETKEESYIRVEEQKKMKENALEQIAALLSFKEAIVAGKNSCCVVLKGCRG